MDTHNCSNSPVHWVDIFCQSFGHDYVSSCLNMSHCLNSPVLPSLNIPPEQVYMTCVKKAGDCQTSLTAWWRTNLNSMQKSLKILNHLSSKLLWQFHTLLLSSLLTYIWLARIFVSNTRVILQPLSPLPLFKPLVGISHSSKQASYLWR